MANTGQLQATVLPADATNKGVDWSSSNTAVATVSSAGLVTAKGVGNAVITAASKADPTKKATCAVEVKSASVGVTGVALDQTFVRAYPGDEFTLVATVSPANATNKAVTWNSSDPDIVSVSSGGEVNILASEGFATITVTTVDGGKTAACEIEIIAQ